MQQQNHPVAQSVTIKVGAFREFATTLAGQVVEQLCQEFEREVQVIHAELWQYRVELERVAELLGKQLGHSKQLHALLEATNDVHSSVVAQMEGLKKQEPDSSVLHDLVEQMSSQHTEVLNSSLSGMSSAFTVAGQHMEKSKAMKQESITAEHEFNRILSLLQQPLVPGQMPQATMAQVPRITGTVGLPAQAPPINLQLPSNGMPAANGMLSPPGSPVRMTGTINGGLNGGISGGMSPVRSPIGQQAARFA